MAETTNRKYRKPLITDAYDSEVFNRNFEMIDVDMKKCINDITEIKKEIQSASEAVKNLRDGDVIWLKH